MHEPNGGLKPKANGLERRGMATFLTSKEGWTERQREEKVPQKMKACTKVALTTICRNCGKPLHRKTDFYFTLRGVEYWICHRCRHKTAITKT